MSCSSGSSSQTKAVSSSGRRWLSAGSAIIRGRREAIVAAITSNVKRVLHGDHEVRAWREAGLLYPSVVTGIIRTIKRDMIAATLGHVAEGDLVAVKGRLREVLDL